MKIQFIGGVLGLILLASGCVTTSPYIGEGTISDNSTFFQKDYDTYLEFDKEHRKVDSTTAFAFSRSSGNSGWFYAFGNNNYSSALKGAIKSCDDSDCKIYAVNGKVVWKNRQAPKSNVSIGKGPIELSAKGKQVYQKYLDVRPAAQDSVFAFSSNAKSGASIWSKDLEEAKTQAIIKCNGSASAKGDPQDCAIYDINGKIVWDFKANLDNSIKNSNQPSSAKERLRLINQTLKEGLITEDEAAAKRAEILSEM